MSNQVLDKILGFSPRALVTGTARFHYSVIATWMTAFCFIVILVMGWAHTRNTIESQLREHVLAMVQLAADRTALCIDTVGGALQAVGDGLQAGDPGSSAKASAERRQTLQATLARSATRIPGLVALTVVDAAGRTVALSQVRGDRGGVSAAATDAPAVTQEDHGVAAISAPFRDPATGMWLVRVTHRIDGRNGAMPGTVVADVALDAALAKYFQRYPLAEGDAISIQDADGRELAIFPPSASGLSGRGAGKAGDGAAPPTDTIQYLSAPDTGSVRLVASRKLSRYPFRVTYGESVDSWLLKWRQEQFMLALAALGALIATAAITTGIQRRFALMGQLQRVRGDLEESNNALRATLAAAEMLAARDQLTGLWNRRNFDQRLEGAIARAARHGDVFSLLMIDIDHFKNINDYYGHSVGDEVLRRFGEVLTARLRQYDVAARWGGEEFVVLADGASLDNARMLAEKIRESIAATSFSPVPRVTVSVGIADFQEGETGDDLLRRADKALYGAKRNGRNRVIAAESGQILKRQLA